MAHLTKTALVARWSRQPRWARLPLSGSRPRAASPLVSRELSGSARAARGCSFWANSTARGLVRLLLLHAGGPRSWASAGFAVVLAVKAEQAARPRDGDRAFLAKRRCRSTPVPTRSGCPLASTYGTPGIQRWHARDDIVGGPERHRRAMSLDAFADHLPAPLVLVREDRARDGEAMAGTSDAGRTDRHTIGSRT